VLPITSNLKLADAPGNVYLQKVKSGLSKDSVVNVSQLITIEKSFLTEKQGQLDALTSNVPIPISKMELVNSCVS
jgi:mRNA interferase MazF